MKHQTLRWTAIAVLVAGAMLASGCAKKQQPPPPQPPPTPSVADTTTPPPPPPPPPPSDDTGPVRVGSGDMQPAFFELDSYSLREDARAALDKNAKLLRDNATVNITVEGHCDERGTAEYNQALGERRAQAARDYLAAAGIDASRMQVISYGKERPFDAGHDESAWAQNRRAHFVVR
ncbi:MAG TPA: peptidoglycan-associated lipoprotein Pal [Candidatus Limnocylindria bacterium]|nr:peptidoglycan-associated lipoprotein Pal [Candidatus Limnocylindria bacterium]